MAARVADAALVRIHGAKGSRCVVNVARLLLQPPHVVLPDGVVVIAGTDPVHARHVEPVAPDFFEWPIPIPMRRELGVAVKFSPQELQALAAELHPPASDFRDLPRFVRMHRRP